VVDLQFLSCQKPSVFFRRYIKLNGSGQIVQNIILSMFILHSYFSFSPLTSFCRRVLKEDEIHEFPKCPVNGLRSVGLRPVCHISEFILSWIS
jgi:hypothetical protein